MVVVNGRAILDIAALARQSTKSYVDDEATRSRLRVQGGPMGVQKSKKCWFLMASELRACQCCGVGSGITLRWVVWRRLQRSLLRRSPLLH